MPRRDDAALLPDILASAHKAVEAIEGKDQSYLRADHLRALGLVKCIEVVGEAASQLGDGFRIRHSGLPWPLMIGMRHRLVHAYFEIDYDQIWSTLTEDLAPLIEQIEAILTEKHGED